MKKIFLKIILLILGRIFDSKKPTALAELHREVLEDVRKLDKDHKKMLAKQKTANPDLFEHLHYRMSVNRAQRLQRIAELGQAILYTFGYDS